MTLTIYITVTAIFAFVLGWFISNHKLRKKFDTDLSTLKSTIENNSQNVISENKSISDQFFLANKLKQENQVSTLNEAFLTNGKTVESIGLELKSAQNLVANAFSSLPNIYTCSERTSEAAQISKNQIIALTESVDSWQGTMSSLKNVQSLVDDIHAKASQIHDVSSEANLLALNASIEAARAGEHGRGFSVVATSMRDLSNKSADATKDITTAVEETRQEVKAISDLISDNLSLLNTVSNDVSKNFSNIENEITNITGLVKSSLSEAEDATLQFKDINTDVNTQLESIVGLLATSLGVITGNTIRDITVNKDFTDFSIIDVRSQDEFNGELGHIDGAQLICLKDKFEQQLKPLDKNRSYLFVCRSGGRSSRAARIALGLGFKNIFNMQGGMLEYCKVNGIPGNASEASSNISLQTNQDDNDEVTLF